MNRIGRILLLFAILNLLTGCSTETQTEISGLTIKDLPNETFYVGDRIEGLEIDVDCWGEFDVYYVDAVIEDTDIVSIGGFYKSGIFSKSIIYDILPLKQGTTTFYFETKDGLVKSEPIEITISANIEDIRFEEVDDIFLGGWQTEKEVHFEIDAYTNIDSPGSVIECVSMNPDVATIEFGDLEKSNCCWIRMTNPGQTSVYLQSSDGEIVSGSINVIVEGEDQEQIDGETSKISDEELEDLLEDLREEDDLIYADRTVYITPYGEKYHYKKSCAGKNAMDTTQEFVQDLYEPCKKCVY